MFSLGIFEVLFILIIGLLILGPQKFPKMAKDIAQIIHRLRSVQHDVKQHAQSLKESAQDIKNDLEKTVEGSFKKDH